jgi:hypothetical protein
MFDLIHCDLWVSPVGSASGYKYYLVILHDSSHFIWSFLLHFMSEMFSTILHFFSYVCTQFGVTVRSAQCDNGHEFNNSLTQMTFLSNGGFLCMSCPYTSQQNG